MRLGPEVLRDPAASDAPPPQDSRIASIHEGVVHLFALVADGLTAATRAFLDGDRELARTLVAGDALIDSVERGVEELAEQQLTLRPLSAERMRTLVAVLRITPELERSGDLVEHIALRASHRLSSELSPLSRRLLEDMGRIVAEMWRAATDAYVERDGMAADRLRVLDDEVDDLHVRLTAELAERQISVPTAIELGLVARFYERLGDHAVNIARHVRHLADGG
jgi:phosphate transport system protein